MWYSELIYMGFPGFTICPYIERVSLVAQLVKNVGDLGLIPGLGRSTGEGIGYPSQYSWASLVAQLVKNLPARQETWVRSLSWEDLLGKASHSCILAWRIPRTVYSMGSQKSQAQLNKFHFHYN